MKIICIGDSLTEGLGGGKEKSWPMILAELGRIEVSNKGISGDTTAGLIGRFYHDVIHCRPTHVIIMGGHNDLWWDIPINTILANIYSMIKQSIHHNISPIIGIPIPIYMEGIDYKDILEPVSGYHAFQDKLSQLVHDLKNMAGRNGWNYIDFYSLYMNERGSVNHHYFLTSDGIHPNAEGHQDMAHLTFNHFEEWGFCPDVTS
ncbi:GDSL-type esterase/lipase family protein [Bacillus paramycoides]|uniref:GDSL-type esterase/lipase family protein n=1 Tax=Bacillus paramycoides TaxID=2026194 RepID=UPI002243CA6D|nr:GDSL-type esterase/lipase family protein [Bacillus paramycoides]MCW9134710.1 GDSL-type esterase/lipase family protein [Bacillus paramycoides]